jgi:hypothetical protein
MGLQLADSTLRHGLEREDVLCAIVNAVLHHPGHQVGRSPDHSPVDLFDGPTRAGALIEVLVERRGPRDVIIFHALPIDDRRLRRVRETRRKR